MAMVLAIDTGLRREELFSLQWTQVDQIRGTITATTKTKSGRARKVPLPPRSRTLIGTLTRRLDQPYVLVNPETETRYVQMNKSFKAAMRRAGITDLCWHDLRRTAACRWLQRDGKTMAEVSGLLGHSSIQVTETRYAFLDLDAVAESLSGRTKVGTGTADKIDLGKKAQ
jgi:integrase